MPTLSEAIAALNARAENGGNFAARIVRDAPMPSDYHLAMYLPEENRETYEVDSGAMAIYPTMAGLTGMDSTYAPVGAISTSRFLEETAKITSELPLSEKHLREIQRLIQRLQATNQDAMPSTQQELIAFTMVLLHAHRDTAEWLRGQTIFNGAINWTYGGRSLTVDYNIPAANKPSTRTGTSAYDKADSTFWADTRLARKALGNNAEAVMERETFYGIVDNPANAIKVEQLATDVQAGALVERYRLTKRLGTENVVVSDDARDSIVVTVYQREGSIIDPNDAKKTVPVSMVPVGKIAFIGSASRPAYRPGRGAEPDLTNNGRIGYYHIAPTTEANGTPGRWARVFTPQDAPYMVRSEAAENSLPVVESPDKLFILSTEIGA